MKFRTTLVLGTALLAATLSAEGFKNAVEEQTKGNVEVQFSPIRSSAIPRT